MLSETVRMILFLGKEGLVCSTATLPVKHHYSFRLSRRKSRIYFQKCFSRESIIGFIAVDSEGVAPEILEKLIAHEKVALEGLIKNGVIF